MQRHVRSSIAMALLMLGSAPATLRAEEDPAATKSTGDPAAGEKVFAKCRSCHQIGETAHNAVGPVLNGVIGRHSGSVPDYSYSDANKNSGLTWDEPTFREYIKNPRAKVPGTKMVFAGIQREKDIDNLVAYLKQYGADGKKTP